MWYYTKELISLSFKIQTIVYILGALKMIYYDEPYAIHKLALYLHEHHWKCKRNNHPRSARKAKQIISIYEKVYFLKSSQKHHS